MNETASIRSSVTSASPSAPPAPVMTFSTPAGRPASCSSAASLMPMIGVAEAGLNTTVLPTTSAGAIFQTGIESGKFQGVIIAQTPSGTRRL